MDDLLATAIRDNNIALIRDLLGNGINVNRGQTPPICIALKEKNLEVVKMLVDSGADLMASGRYGDSPIMVAIQSGCLEAVDVLVRAGVEVSCSSCKKDSCTPLYIAVMHQHPHIVSYLLEAGAQVNQPSPQLYSGNTALHRASSQTTPQGLEMVNILLAHGANVKAVNDDNQTPLHLAATEGNTESVKRLLQCGADINKLDNRQSTALGAAAALGHEGVVRHLCIQGAAINLTDKAGRTPLQVASIARHIAVMKTLLRFGASVDKGNPLSVNRTALLEVIRTCKTSVATLEKLSTIPPKYYLQVNREIEVLDTLVDGGADVNLQDNAGNSALHMCVKHGCEELLDYLINRGADPTLVNENGYTALSLACADNVDCMVVKLSQLCPLAVTHPNNGRTALGSRSPFIHLVRHSNLKSLRLLMEAGYRPTKGELDQYETQTTTTVTKSSMDRELGNPWSLLRVCRASIRNLLKNDIINKVYKLPIPDKLRDDILLQSPSLLYAAEIQDAEI